MCDGESGRRCDVSENSIKYDSRILISNIKQLILHINRVGSRWLLSILL